MCETEKLYFIIKVSRDKKVFNIVELPLNEEECETKIEKLQLEEPICTFIKAEIKYETEKEIKVNKNVFVNLVGNSSE